jgi:hypothetical protein
MEKRTLQNQTVIKNTTPVLASSQMPGESVLDRPLLNSIRLRRKNLKMLGEFKLTQHYSIAI